MNYPDVHCSYTEIVSLSDLVPNPRNPNKHPQKQVNLLAEIIQQQGWRSPIVVSKRSGFIVQGHGRHLAAKHLGLESAPVDYQDFDSDALEWAQVIADNRIAELSNIDKSLMADLICEIDTLSDLDLSLTAFSEAEIEKMMLAAPPQIENPSDPKACPNCGFILR